MVLSTVSQLQEFKESIIWKDFCQELDSWRESFQQELLCLTDKVADENLSTPSVLVHLGDVSARIKAVDYMLLIPDTLIATKLMELESTTRKEDEGEEKDESEIDY